MSRLTAAERKAVQLIFVGASASADAEFEHRLRQSVSAAGLGEQVRFLGHRGDVPDLIAAADVLLHASIEPEPFGLVVVEGLALGKAVIASCLGGPSEILGADYGLTFSPERPADLTRHLSMLLARPDQRKAIGAAGQLRAPMFEIANTVAATTQIYDHLLGRHN
jgi:glycosyltransferase involved in cell wall biosynthesis